MSARVKAERTNNKKNSAGRKPSSYETFLIKDRLATKKMTERFYAMMERHLLSLVAFSLLSYTLTFLPSSFSWSCLLLSLSLSFFYDACSSLSISSISIYIRSSLFSLSSYKASSNSKSIASSYSLLKAASVSKGPMFSVFRISSYKSLLVGPQSQLPTALF